PSADGEPRVRHARDREPRRKSAPVEVVPHIRLRQPAGLRAGGQEGGHRAAREAASVHGRRASRDLGALGRWVHDGGRDADYPDFFKVGWSESGNHENNIYNNTWSEKHHGVKEIEEKDGKVRFEYSIDKNSEIAKNLKGHLMLVTGDIDNNVHPSNTYRLADALIKANKRFEFMILPGQGHSYLPVKDYVVWRRADYFAKHLLGESDESIDMWMINREKHDKPEAPAAGRGQTGGRRGAN